MIYALDLVNNFFSFPGFLFFHCTKKPQKETVEIYTQSRFRAQKVQLKASCGALKFLRNPSNCFFIKIRKVL
jgi:hypothetical protein